MRKVSAAILALILVCVLTAWSQQQSQSNTAITNQDVITMTKAGLPADVVVAKIKSSPTKFDTSPSALAELKKDGVPDSVILAMVEGSGKPTDAAKPSATDEPKPASDA